MLSYYEEFNICWNHLQMLTMQVLLGFGVFFPRCIIITYSGQHASNSAVLSTKKQKLTFHIENNFIYRKKYFEK